MDTVAGGRRAAIGPCAGLPGALLFASFLLRNSQEAPIQEARCPSLTFIDLRGNQLQERGKALVARAIEHCGVPFLSIDEFSIEGAEVTELDVCNRGLSVADMELLAAVMENNDTLQSTNILGNTIKEHALKELQAQGAAIRFVHAVARCDICRR